ncbi:tripartite tricarboxylate transporter substrate binding protein [Effusibacillus dendaii]|uniref:Tripartite tricarboxylate transporter substrate binding protein n=1 Tax=Effusibacillus dendaii TaxID=2743772 RepID=A0A7I8DGI5_9BACL|nr:tripartite tricarboxylate transporter substrate binding protein [Effusibacillus dendaii]BCJ87700.1 hypothetical protein skT53_26850 [Effusibacillus dendaii]
MKKWISLILVAFLAVFSVACSSGKSAASSESKEKSSTDFPNKPISIVLPSSAGAPIDVMARKLAEVASKYLNNVPINIVNKTGGSGMVAMAYTQSQPANGYTLHGEATGITSVLQMKGAQFRYSDFVPVSRIELDPFALFVKEGGKYKTLQDLIDDAKKNPGKITIGGYGTGTPHHIVAMDFAEKAGVDVKWVAFNSGTDAITAVMGDSLDAALTNTSSIERFVGKAKVLAHSSEKPISKYPDLKSFKDQGFDIVKYHWRGLFVKAGTPKEIVDRLADGFNKAVKDPEFQKYLNTVGNLSGEIARDDFEKIVNNQASGDLTVLKKLNLAQ